MKSLLYKYRKFFIVLIVFSVVTISLFYTALKPKKTLPIYSPADVNPELVDSTIQYKSKYHTIGDFSFVNQNGDTITQKNYEGKIYVADFFFTTCGSICPKMSTNLSEVQKAVLNNPKVMLLSHTVFPEVDSVSVLKAYAIKYGVVDSKWNLVTGDKKEIYKMARKSYLAVKLGRPDQLYDMVHTENFVLVDQKRRVRGFYDGTNKEDIKRLLEDIEFLSQEDSEK
ncbi:SCO family protein [Flavobacterium procerum]|uniref:SCO family protein n=1 Tax=Flavobacterium procerum TaxID=1455569 RepID=A0ABV6BLU1_9FLAO